MIYCLRATAQIYYEILWEQRGILRAYVVEMKHQVDSVAERHKLYNNMYVEAVISSFLL